MPLPLPPAPGLAPLFLPAAPAPTTLARDGQDLPLLGLTVLAVEDSRFACDAMRLMCQHLGARLRRAETLASARAHLKVYRPDVVIIDLGLPDGRGEALIRDLATQDQPRPVVLGTSGDAAGRAAAFGAGAVGFLEKPLESIATFCTEILHHLPTAASEAVQNGANPANASLPASLASALVRARVSPDPLALRDDLTRAAGLIAAGPDADERRYLAGFLSGLGRSAHDKALERAAQTISEPAGFDRLCGLVSARIDRPIPAITQTEVPHPVR